MSGALQSSRFHVDGCRGLEEVAGELIHWIAESYYAACHATPLHVHRLDDCAHNVTQRMSGIETIGNCERIEHAEVPDVKLSGTPINVNFRTVLRYWFHPKHEGWGNSGIVGMQAQRACGRKAVKSYERERTAMRFAISGESATHEPHIRVKAVGRTVAIIQVCAGSSQQQICASNDPAEVEDFQGIMPVIWVCTVDATGPELVDRRTQTSVNCVRDWLRL
jgi:hypothetical protein